MPSVLWAEHNVIFARRWHHRRPPALKENHTPAERRPKAVAYLPELLAVKRRAHSENLFEPLLKV